MAISARAVRCDCIVLLTCCAHQPMTDTLSSGLRPKPRPKPTQGGGGNNGDADDDDAKSVGAVSHPIKRPHIDDRGDDGRIRRRCPQASRCIVPEDLIIINGNGGDITDGIIIARCSRVSGVRGNRTRR